MTFNIYLLILLSLIVIAIIYIIINKFINYDNRSKDSLNYINNTKIDNTMLCNLKNSTNNIINTNNKIAVLFCIADYDYTTTNDLIYPINDCLFMVNFLLTNNFIVFILCDNIMISIIKGTITQNTMKKYFINNDLYNKFLINLKIFKNKIIYNSATELNLYDVVNTIYLGSINTIQNKTVFFYFSGHGVKSKDIYNSNGIKVSDNTNSAINDINNNRINEWELNKNIIEKLSKSYSLYFIYDNCHSGGFLDSISKIYNTNNMKNLFVLSASTYLGYGYDNAKTTHGLLTSKLIKGDNLKLLNNFKVEKNFSAENNIYYFKLLYKIIISDYKTSPNDYSNDNNNLPCCFINGICYDYNNLPE